MTPPQASEAAVLSVMDSRIAALGDPEQEAENSPRRRTRNELTAARSALAELVTQASRAERLLRDMAEAGFGEPTQADALRDALLLVGGK